MKQLTAKLCIEDGDLRAHFYNGNVRTGGVCFGKYDGRRLDDIVRELEAMDKRVINLVEVEND